MSVKALLTASVIALSSAMSALADQANGMLFAAFNKEVQTLDGLYSTSRENLILSYLTSDQLVELNLETVAQEADSILKNYAVLSDRYHTSLSIQQDIATVLI